MVAGPWWWSVHQFGKDPELLGIAPDLAGLIGVVDFTGECVAAPFMADVGGSWV